MPTFSTPSPSSRSTAGSSQDVLLQRIDARLERIEARLAKLDPLLDAAPGLVAMAGDSFDELAAELGDFDERLRAIMRLLERATRPHTLNQLELAFELLEAAPGLVAMIGDSFDAFMAEAQVRGLPIERIVPELGRALEATLRLLTHEQVQQLLESDLLLPGAIEALGTAARALAVSQRSAIPSVGLLGTLSAMREPEVQRALGFAIDVARRFGTNLDLDPSNALPPAPSAHS